ncbi:MAG: MFS transporter [Chloroflexi bacterium]|nr:MFS transporter [Chloroflexota bacterium]
MTETTTQSKTLPARPWLVLALICVPVFIGSLDLTIVSAFLPEIIIGLGLPLQTSLDDSAWVVSGYLLAYAVSMTFMGRISDLLGRRWVYITCLVIFIIGSVLVASAHLWPTDTLYTLFRRLGQRPDRESVTLLAIILGRVVQAFGAGALVPVSLALVGDLFPAARRAQPLGVIGAVDTLGWVLGHLYGGLLVNFFATHKDGFRQLLDGLGLSYWPSPDWRTLFWINVPVTLVGLALTLWALRRVPMHRAAGRFDWAGALLITGALVGLIVGLGANIEVSSTTATFEQLSRIPSYAGPVLLLALALFGGFVLVERRVRNPLIEPAMFRHRNLSAGALVNLFVGFCLMIGLVSVPILVNIRIQDASKLSEAALQAGVLLSALTVPMALAAVPGGWLSDRFGYQKTTAAGLALAAAGFALIWQTWRIDLPDAIIALDMLLVGVGLGLTFSPISAAVINSADEDHRGVASALVIILRLIGMTVAVAALTSLALQRVSQLAAAELGPTAADPTQFVDVYARITVQVLGEMGLLGALICGLALVPAIIGLRREPSTPAAATGDDRVVTPGD